MKKKFKGNKTAALLGAIAMVMIAVVSIVGVTFAWFTASPDPRVTGIQASVAGADTLLMSHLNAEGTFRSTVTWGEISGLTSAKHTAALIADKLSPVTPIALANNKLDLAAGTLHETLKFVGGMEFDETLFEEWFDEADSAEILAVLGAAYTVINAEVIEAAQNVELLYSDLAWASSAKAVALTWYKYGSQISNTSGNWYYFPLFFRSLSGDTDIYLELPTNYNGTEFTFVDTEMNNTLGRQLISQSIRFAFVQNAYTVGTYNEPATGFVYKPYPERSDNSQAAGFLGDLAGERGGGNIVPNLYETTLHGAGEQINTSYGERNLLKVGFAPEYDDENPFTTVCIGVYIWVDGNDIYNTSFSADSLFLAQLSFFGIKRG